jgi:hypothetical protein
MSRGPGTWQRAILDITGDGLATTVRAVVLDTVAQPTRGDYVSARRATKTLALAGRVSAVYLHACPSCGALHRTQPHRCCASIRPMLGITPAGSHPPSLAPPPVSPVPDWISAAPTSKSITRSEVASHTRLLEELIQHGYRRLTAGEITVATKDLLAALRLQAQIEAIRSQDHPEPTTWQDAMVAVLQAARRHLGPERFPDLLADVRNSPAIRQSSPSLTVLGVPDAERASHQQPKRSPGAPDEERR